MSFRKLPSVIGLYSPREQSGKSTVTAYLNTTIFAPAGRTMVNIKISAPLKDLLYALGLTEDDVEGRLKETPNPKLGGKTPRQAMIDAYKQGAAAEGTDWLAKRAAVRILQSLVDGHIVVVDDVRTPEDYAMVNSFRGAEVWRIFRPKAGEANTAGHIGKATNIEGMLENQPFNLRLENTSTLADLYTQIDRYFSGC